MTGTRLRLELTNKLIKILKLSFSTMQRSIEKFLKFESRSCAI